MLQILGSRIHTLAAPQLYTKSSSFRNEMPDDIDLPIQLWRRCDATERNIITLTKLNIREGTGSRTTLREWTRAALVRADSPAAEQKISCIYGHLSAFLHKPFRTNHPMVWGTLGVKFRTCSVLIASSRPLVVSSASADFVSMSSWSCTVTELMDWNVLSSPCSHMLIISTCAFVSMSSSVCLRR